MEENSQNQMHQSSKEVATSVLSLNEKKKHNLTCSLCNKLFRYKSKLKTHLLTHESEKPLACSVEICSRRFNCKYNLRKHLNSHKLEFKCNKCEKQFKTKQKLYCHMAEHKDPPTNFSCNLCDLKFSSNTNLQFHLKSHDQDSFDCCTICNKNFPRIQTTQETGKKKYLPYYCYVCDTDFRRKIKRSEFESHLQSHETDDKPFSCHVCDKRFTVDQNLQLHLSFHNKSDGKMKHFVHKLSSLCEDCAKKMGGNGLIKVKSATIIGAKNEEKFLNNYFNVNQNEETIIVKSEVIIENVEDFDLITNTNDYQHFQGEIVCKEEKGIIMEEPTYEEIKQKENTNSFMDGSEIKSFFKPHEVIVPTNANMQFKFENENDDYDFIPM